MCQTIQILYIRSDVLTTISICYPGGSRYQPWSRGGGGGGGAGGGGVTRGVELIPSLVS